MSPGDQLATFIVNPIRRQGWIKGVYFKLKKIGSCKNSIRIRLLRLDTILPEPGVDILNENITLFTDVLKKTNYLDLSDYKLTLPENSVFVVIAWLYPDSECDKKSYFSIGANLKIDSNLVWLNFRDESWGHSNKPRLPNGNFMTPNVALKIAY